SSGGEAGPGTVVASGGRLVLLGGAIASGVVIRSAGTLQQDLMSVGAGQTVSLGNITGAIGGVTLDAGAIYTAAGATVASGGVLIGGGQSLSYLDVQSGGTARGLSAYDAGGGVEAGGVISGYSVLYAWWGSSGFQIAGRASAGTIGPSAYAAVV